MSVCYANLGGSLDDAALVKKLFDTVLDRYINVITGIEQFFDLKKIAFDEAFGRMKAFEERTRQGARSARSNTDQVLLTQAEWEARQKRSASDGGSRSGSGRGRGLGHSGGSSGRGNNSDGGKEGTGKHDKSHIKCYKCKNYGHYGNRCPGKKEEEAHYTKKVNLEPTVLLAKTMESG